MPFIFADPTKLSLSIRLLQKQGALRLLLLFAYWRLLELHSSPRSWVSVIRFDLSSQRLENFWERSCLSYLLTTFYFTVQLGAFLAGALLAETNFRTQIEADIRPFKGLLLGLFFVTTGSSIDMQVLQLFCVAQCLLFKHDVLCSCYFQYLGGTLVESLEKTMETYDGRLIP